ncbi:hypothetical protein BN439_1479 [Erwinia amylovora Ea644]|uniref:YbfA family protein n=1 Tax=Erwinia amylovora TaxID=552 RepID=UPI0002CC0846|nr:YbfA family protein [Erwinia amylovora]CCP02551.1 hypothetical protein BN439_1479 [Erwinia amylovora Ea644]CCP06561.1 hypothetical protein BN440_1525 [Erwinia amylovora MR1]
MGLYQHYSFGRIFLRRSLVLILGISAFPLMLFRSDRARFYSYLHRMWVKTSDRPVWLAQAEDAGCNYY